MYRVFWLQVGYESTHILLINLIRWLVFNPVIAQRTHCRMMILRTL